LTGVTPVASDPGQPVRLALRSSPTRNAQAAPAVEQPEQVAAYVPQPQPATERDHVPQFDQLAAAPTAEPAPAFAATASAPAPAPAAVEQSPAPQSAGNVIAAVAAAVLEAPSALADMVGLPKTESKSKVVAKLKPARAAHSPRNGKSTAVVQIGAYGSPERVAAAWNAASKRHSALRDFTPMSARFNSPKGVVYRLSVKGFSGPSEAKNLCVSLRRAGGSCFVRSVAGDAPVRLASR
jgi:D-alanyl-D-alanine carboxypeptidase